MIPHHRQAVMMADMVENYADGPEGESAGDSDTSVPKAIRIAPIEQ